MHPFLMSGEFAVKFCRLLGLTPIVITGLLLLQSCQHSTETKKEEAPTATIEKKEKKLDDAASYNTQLGLAYLKQGNRERAKSKLFLALSQAPDSPVVNASVAYLMEKVGEMDKAHSYYKKAIALAPGSGAQLNNYGTFLCRQGQYREAETYFLQAVKDVRYPHTSGAYENAGLCVMAIPDKVKAAHYFAKALEQDPSRVQSLYELVNLEVKQNHVDEALSYLKKYSNLTLNDRTLLKLAADVAQKAGKSELEEQYQTYLRNFAEKTGGKEDEYNNNNG